MALKNKFEQKINRQLKRAKSVYTYETEKIPFVIASHYIPDFIVQTELGRVYIECKGYLRPEDKRKLIAVKRQHPAKDIRLLFYSFNPKQVKWAERNGFRFAFEKIPSEWLKGL
jgi:predicted nuclease of restriction endonuclease-like RecB superfamily